MGAAASLHPTDQILQSYGLGKLDDQSAESVSEHLDSCPDCQRRVAEMSSDTFLGKLQNAQGRPNQAAGGLSQLGVSTTGGGSAVRVEPAKETLPPGLAEHPDYEIKRELGRGGMGVVYLAHNTLMGRDEVLKVMSRQIIERPGVLERFLREIRAVASLRHPNIVTAFHAARIGDSIVFAMEYVDGLDLSRMVKAKGPLPVSHACNFAYQAALGLQHAHEEGLVHRDIKPGNLMLARKGDKATIKILDFGLAKVTREEKVDGSLTSEGQALGTPDFMAPEQILDAQSADIRADIYSVGATLYYLLTGRPPFQANSLYDMYQAHISRDPDPLNFIRPEVPAKLAALVAKMMAKDPSRRFQTPGEATQALAPFFKRGNVGFKVIEQKDSAQDEKGSSLGTGNAGFKVVQRRVTPPPLPVGSQQGTAAVNVPTAPLRTAARALSSAKNAGDPIAGTARWESLIELRETDGPMDEAPAVEPTRRPPWKKWSVAVAAFALGLIALGVIIITIRDKEGREIGRYNVPDGATVVIEDSGNKVGSNPPEKVRDGAAGRGSPISASGEPANAPVITSPADSRDGIGAAAHRSPLQVVLRSKVERRALVISGSWMTRGDELVQTSPAYQISELVFGDPNWSHYDLSFEVKKDTEGWGEMGGRRFTILFHWLSANNKCWYSGYNDAHEIASIVDGNWSRDWELRAGNWVWAKGELQDGKWYPVSIKVRGKAVKCFFNNNLMFDDVHPSLARGRIGLGTADAQVRFRRIKVIDPDGVVLFEGLPNIASGDETTGALRSATIAPRIDTAQRTLDVTGRSLGGGVRPPFVEIDGDNRSLERHSELNPGFRRG